MSSVASKPILSKREAPLLGTPRWTVWSLLKQTAIDFNQDNAMRLAAAMGCYIMLALAPLLVIALKVFSVQYEKQAGSVVEQQVNQLVGPAGAKAIGEMIQNANTGGGGNLATAISLAIVVFSASGVFASLQDALNTIWEVKPDPNAGWWQWFQKRFLSMGMVFGIAILLMTSMFVTATLHLFIDAIFGFGEEGFLANAVAYSLDFVMTILVAWALFMAVFKWLPDAKLAWRDVWVGGLITAVLFKLGQIGMAVYFARGATDAYGTFASIMAVLLWAYYSSTILFLGAEFTQVWAAAHGRAIRPEATALKVTELERAKQGIPGTKPALQPKTLNLPAATCYASPDANTDRKMYGMGVGGLIAGAVAAGVATWYYANDPKRLTRKRAADTKLDERVQAIETKLGRVNRIREYLDQMDVKERIDTVEREIQRAGRHVRAKETGRPLWMVRLGDLIGGRWSNV